MRLWSGLSIFLHYLKEFLIEKSTSSIRYHYEQTCVYQLTPIFSWMTKSLSKRVSLKQLGQITATYAFFKTPFMVYMLAVCVHKQKDFLRIWNFKALPLRCKIFLHIETEFWCFVFKKIFSSGPYFLGFYHKDQ